MGNLIITNPQPADSSWDEWEVHSSTTRDGTFTLLNQQVLTNPTFYHEAGISTTWYKTRFENTTGPTNSEFSHPFVGGSVHYTTPNRVGRFLHLTTLTDTSNPTIQAVAEIIQEKEDEIDYRTGHAWRMRFSGTQSGKETLQPRFKYYDVQFLYEYQGGAPIYLDNRKIEDFDTAQGDVLEIWNGNEYDDWLTVRTEGREEDWWLDNHEGVLRLKARYGIQGPTKARLKYRYGEAIVNELIKSICTKMVAVELLQNESKAVFVQEGGGASIPFATRIEMWEKQIETGLNSLKEFQVPRRMDSSGR